MCIFNKQPCEMCHLAKSKRRYFASDHLDEKLSAGGLGGQLGSRFAKIKTKGLTTLRKHSVSVLSGLKVFREPSASHRADSLRRQPGFQLTLLSSSDTAVQELDIITEETAE